MKETNFGKIFGVHEKRELLNYLTELAEEDRYIFRGYSIQDEMNPSIIRNKAVHLERDLLIDFERYGSQYLNISSPIDLMSYAQHFGLSTRLLDFTFNPFIALYFALFRRKPTNAREPEDNIYYYIRYADKRKNDYRQELLSEVSSRHLHRTISDSWAQKAINCIDQVENTLNDQFEKKILFIDSNQSNQRLVMQQGLFMFPYTLSEYDHDKIIKNNTALIKIHKDLRTELQCYLDTIGIDAFRLMPDLANVCIAVERKLKEGRRKR